MTLSDLSIRRPVFAWMLMFGLIVFGAISFSRMGVSELPDVDFPVIAISARYEGAAPEVMEAEVIDPLEDALISIQGVKNLMSTTRAGSADITLEFGVERNIDQAFQDVQAKIAATQAMLPQQLDPLTVMKINPEDFPIMWLSVASTKMSMQDLMLFVKDDIRDRLTTVPGVGNVWMPGYLEPNLRVWVDPVALKRYALSATDIVAAIKNEHTEPPSGRTEFKQREYSLRTLGEEKTVDAFSKILINSRGGGPNYNPIPISAVAKVEEGVADAIQFARSNGQPAVGLGIVKQRGANAVSVAREVKARLAAVQKTLPEGTSFVVNYDGTKFVEDSIGELVLTLALSAVLTSFVCWLFLGSWGSTLNVLLAIPTSVLGSFIILYFCNFTLNTFTLLGLSLAIGIVVDDAIMVLENIIRYREKGKKRRDAALIGAREITFAAVATSVSLVAIFLPIAFMEGLIGKFLYQFGVTMSAAVMISLVEALTLTPMRAAYFNDAEAGRGKVGQVFESGFERLKERYRSILSRVLDNRWKTLLASLVFFILSFGSVMFLKGEFQPAQDMSAATILLNNPPGSGVSFTEERVRKIEDFLAKRSEVSAYFVAAGGFSGGEPHAAMIFVELKRPGSRGKSAEKGRELTQAEFIDVAREFLNKTVPESKPIVQDPSTQGFGGGGSKGFPAEFTIQGPDWKKLGEYSRQIIEQLKKDGTMTDVDSDLLDGAPEVHIVPNRKRASESGVEVQAIGTVINTLIGGTIAGSFPKGGHRYDIRVKAIEDGRSPMERIKDFSVRNNRGQLVPLAGLVDVKESTVPSMISRKNRNRAIMIYGNLGKGLAQQEVLTRAEATAKKIMPEGYGFYLAGSAEEFKAGFISFLVALIMGFVVAYMILASQFNSFLHPVTVFMAMPFSFSGAFLALVLTGQTMNMFSMIGLILLMGIVKKNSILLVDFTNNRRDEQGMDTHDALMDACPTRLRPILMTTLATIAGALPAAFAFGPGAETRKPMAIAVIGGVIVSTLLTLVVVPCVYSLFTRFDRSRRYEDQPA
jgi:hydrophobe/amphiphile efflux-1 (HAE1) family protein